MDTSPSVPSPQTEPLRDPEALFALMYQELHTLASRHLFNQGMGVTLGTTTLLHEAYLNIAGRQDLEFPDRNRFLGYASRAMRGLIVDYARTRSAMKRGGEFVLLPLGEEHDAPAIVEAHSMEALSESLDELGRVDHDLAELVDLHFFCSLSLVEIAAIRGVSDRTVQRDWRKARMILHRSLRPDPLTGPKPDP